ncbi:MAG: TonB-dependent receptor [Acidobacteria bacterium]|nr:TonB-dependent receptor [Acidobacteriota bacterium]MBS1865583.1 TonB-dependent receptor [Acidobacteriota bacterium]
MKSLFRRSSFGLILGILAALTFTCSPAFSQQTLGSINGTVTDSSGGIIAGATVKVRNLATNFERTSTTNSDGSFVIPELPIGTYEVTFLRDGFKKEIHSEILVQGSRTTTVLGSLQPGEVASQVTVTATPLLNQTDTTNGYVLSSDIIESTPLGTGSFTQLAILAPGVSADLLNSSGTNGGLGNQSVFANGQRDTSNSISFNGITANNLFNGKTSSQVAANRFVLSTGETFVGNTGDIQTSTSVYNAIGQGIPSPPQETLEELDVNTSMYDASQGANSGAHIEQRTKSGTNEFHGGVYEYHQTDAWNAAPFFRKLDPSIPANQKVPRLHYNRFGATIGGPIKRDKIFFFGSYQGIRVSDNLNATSFLAVPPSLTDDRSPTALAAVAQTDFGVTVDPTQINPIALQLLQTKTAQGGFLIPSAANPGTPPVNGHTAIIQGQGAVFLADQFNGNVDYNFSAKDRLAAKYYFQHDPTTSPFATSQVLGFPQQLNAGSQALSVVNTTVVSPSFAWVQKIGFIRERAFATTTQPFGPDKFGINIFGSKVFPGITLSDADANGDPLGIGPSGSPFANAGVFQNQFSGGTSASWVRGRHTIAFGFSWDHTQLNIINKSNQAASLTFASFPDLLTGTLRLGEGNSVFFNGASNRYYRANQTGAFAQDNVKVAKNLTVTLGLRFDWDGPLTEKNGLLTNFYPKTYTYDLGTDTVTNIGLVVAGNNRTFGTKGVSDSTLTGRQWGLAPRIGVVWNPSFVPNFVIRSSFGLYYDRGEFFSEFSPSAGNGFNGPFGVTLAPPFVVPTLSTAQDTFANPFGTTAPAAPPTNLSQVAALVPCQGLNASQTCQNPQAGGITTNGLVTGSNPFLFGGYDPSNKLPYSENWSLDLQWQPINTLALTLAYVGNHGVHGVLPIPFNQPRIATTTNPVNGQTVSYGYQVPGVAEEIYNTSTGGNTDLRAPFIGYSPNSVFYEAEGNANYHALQFSAKKRLSHGLTVDAAYTWSHSLDMQSGLGLFFTGNDPLNPRSAYSSSDFDRTHIFSVSYHYLLPTIGSKTGLLPVVANGWGFSGITVAQSGQPYSIYDFSGGVASIYYGTNNFIGNPIVPLLPGQSVSSAQKVPPCSGPGGSEPACSGPTLVNIASFGIPLIAAGQMGVPAGDPFETSFGNTGRNIFRSPFQTRFDFSVFKEFRFRERFKLRFDVQAFNIFNHASFDAPSNNVSFNPFFANPPLNIDNFTTGYTVPPRGSGGTIQHTIGSPRFLQMALHLTF